VNHPETWFLGLASVVAPNGLKTLSVSLQARVIPPDNSRDRFAVGDLTRFHCLSNNDCGLGTNNCEAKTNHSI
jgi:hypothetical protein